MLKMTDAKVAARPKRNNSFTLIELLTVMAIIAILAALVLYAGTGVMKTAARRRATTEIQAMSTALESYKTDNGIYPQDSTLTTNYLSVDVKTTGAGSYQVPAETLYTVLSGQVNFASTPLSAGKSYMAFKASQLGNVGVSATASGAGATTYVQDPFKYPYGYSTGTGTGGSTTNFPYNGNGFFDLWSTGGITGTAATNVNAWISNWQ